MLVVIDPGHGGSDPGAVYNGRQEKDDVLRLGKAVGALLEARGVDVVYTREGDIYETPFKKAQDGNGVRADYFVSIHRNSSEYPNQYSGAEVLVYSDSGIRRELANNILEGMEKAGLKNLGIDERKDLVVLRRTQMPAVLVEAGFINSDKDNETFDRNFDELAHGIANGILQTLGYPVYTSSAIATADMWQGDGNMGNAGNNGGMDGGGMRNAGNNNDIENINGGCTQNGVNCENMGRTWEMLCVCLLRMIWATVCAAAKDSMMRALRFSMSRVRVPATASVLTCYTAFRWVRTATRKMPIEC